MWNASPIPRLVVVSTVLHCSKRYQILVSRILCQNRQSAKMCVVINIGVCKHLTNCNIVWIICTALQVTNYTTSDQLHFEWPTALRVTNYTTSDQLHYEWPTALRVTNYTTSDKLHYEWPTALRVTSIHLILSWSVSHIPLFLEIIIQPCFFSFLSHFWLHLFPSPHPPVSSALLLFVLVLLLTVAHKIDAQLVWVLPWRPEGHLPHHIHTAVRWRWVVFVWVMGVLKASLS